VLSEEEGADEAVQNCWLTASQDQPRFEHEGAFRSWLLRVDEALAIARKKRDSRRQRSAAKVKTFGGQE
jgi:DNA-directed RNA polymerase specialized sigma24 family protein